MFKYIFVNIFLLCAFAETSAQGKKCLVELSITVTDSIGNPVEGTFSLSVADADVVKPDSVQPMLESYMLLNSELKGHIENPNYYFTDDNRRTAHHLDLLMMTQGWRRYNLDNITKGEYPEITHSIETGQTISGEVKGTMGNKVKNVNLHLVTPHIGKRDVIPLNDNKRFTITGLDFTDGTTFLLQAVRENGRDKFLQLEVDSVTFPIVDVPTNEEQTRLIPLPKKFDTQARTQVMYAGADGVTELPEVVKTGMTLRKPMNVLGQEPQRWLTDDDPYLKSSGDFNNILTRLGKEMSNLGVVYLDNIEEPEPEVYLSQLRPEEIASIEIFPRFHPGLLLYGSREYRLGATFIFTKIPDYGSPLSMKSITPKGYKPEVEFYSPQYPAKDKSVYSRLDHRTTLYWNPRMKTDERGRAKLKFFSSDVSKKYLVTMEGICEDGMMVSEVVNIKQ